MNDDAPPTLAEERLQEHLLILREEPPQPGMELTKHIVRRARWQRGLREPLRAVGRLLSAAVAGIAVVAGLRSRAGKR